MMPLASLTTATALSTAVLAASTPSTNGFPQYPSVSPNGQVTVFSLGGDLWAVPTGGGHAERLTAHEATERRSAFSPDGNWLAFESDRNGANSIFVMPVEQRGGRLVATGPIERLVVSDRSQALSGFTPEGDAVLFWSSRDPSLFRESGMYMAPLDHGPVTPLTKAKGERPRISGDTLWFSRGGAPMERPGYRGSSNHDVWSMDMTDGTFRRVTSNRANDTSAFPTPSGDVILLSSRDGQNNLWRLPAGDSEENMVQLTTLAPAAGQATIGHGARDLTVSADGQTAVFAVWDQLHRLDLDDPASGPSVIDLRVGPDHATSPTRRQRLNTAVTEVARHPDGKAIAVAARGELMVRSTEDDHPTHRITEDHARDQSIAWSPDGQKLYFTSDRDGHEGIWAATVSLSRGDLEDKDDEKSEDNSADTTEAEDSEDKAAPDADEPAPDADAPKPIVANDNATAEPAESKDDEEDKKATPKNESGKRWAEALRFDIEPVIVNDSPNHHPMPSPDGRSLLYMKERGDLYLRDLASGEDRLLLKGWWPPEVQWASDSRHIVYATMDLDFNGDIWIMDVESPESAVNLTRHPDVDESPRLSADGKVLIFRSDRRQIGGSDEYDVYRVFLDESLDGMTDWERANHFEAADKVAGKIKMIDTVDLEEDAEANEPLEFENLDTAWRRAQQITSFDGGESDLLLSPGGNAVVFSANVDGTSGLYRVDAMGKDRKRIVSGSVSDLRINPSGSTLSYVSGGSAKTVPIKGGTAKSFGVSADAEIVIADEQAQKFDETARLFGRWFYHPDLKGLDWEALSDQYRDLATTTRTPQEFNRVVTMFFGEVEGSHTGISGGGGFSASSDPIGYLGLSARPVPGGYEVIEVLDRSPAAHEDSRIEIGDVITAVNDKPLADGPDRLPLVDLNSAMAGTRGQETLLDVRSPGEEGGEAEDRIVIISPISWYSWSTLSYNDEIRRNQELVDELSDGRLGYLHIRSMNMPSVHEFEHQLYAAAHGKEGLVIDVRNNGGGWTTDILLTSLTAPVHASTIPRGVAWEDAPSDAYPQDRRLIYAWSRPIVVLANEHSFSNAEIFTHAIKNENRGRVVGEETFGGVISTGSFRLIDGSRVRRPFRGWRLPDGTDMEARGAMPDIRVERTPTDEAAGRDRQLEVAIDDLVKQLNSGE
ncbi:MAG: S41 family peptidase [Phycisphaerales bacterium]|nr:S41 family peptidase [Phycisphaerales bacterium]